MDIIIDNQILTKINSINYLGIIVDYKLNWLENITYVQAKISESALYIKLGIILIKTT